MVQIIDVTCIHNYPISRIIIFQFIYFISFFNEATICKKNTINFCEEKIYNFIKKNKNEFKKLPILQELLYFNIKRLK